ncbi:helix-turn-helix domain-containing protein [Streptomyces sp. NBC_00047]|uniref:helix-turn-helix domain-containing protein n=1 Tax=Streptomyces sp. NBC_00047 TaxID=2975627 RepID=UPI0033902EFC
MRSWTTTKLAVARARHAKGESVTAIAKALGIGRATLSATWVRESEEDAHRRRDPGVSLTPGFSAQGEALRH